MTNDERKINELTHLFMHLGTKFAELEKKSIDLGTGERLFPTEYHTIEAIGKGYGQTVTDLCDYFDVTKGAVSQMITRLEQKGYVEKRRNIDFSKEKIISLTPKGSKAFHAHQELHREMDQEIADSLRNYSEKEIAMIVEFLHIAENQIQKFIDL